jgi:hypothetical protein
MTEENKSAAKSAEKPTAAPQRRAQQVQTTNPPRQDLLAANAVADEPGAAALQNFVKEQSDRHAAQGHRGDKTDRTPNENYTVAGVGAGLPTPETTVVQE